MAEKPPWRIAVEEFERSIGAPIEELVKSDEFAGFAAEAAKRQAVMQQEVTAASNQWLHALNLPTATDLTELRQDVAALRAEIRALTEQLDGRPAAVGASQTARSSTSPRARQTAAKTTPKSRTSAKNVAATNKRSPAQAQAETKATKTTAGSARKSGETTTTVKAPKTAKRPAASQSPKGE